MSRELIFYPAFRQEGKYIPLLRDPEGAPAEILWRSGSFIEMDFFTEEFLMISPSQANSFFEKEEWADDEATFIYEISTKDLRETGKERGMVSGYVPLDDMIGYAKTEEKQEYLHWEMSEPLPAEIYAELPPIRREGYGRFSAIDTYSAGYICSVLLEILNDLSIPCGWKGEPCILAVYSF